jgi:hypothetical protein
VSSRIIHRPPANCKSILRVHEVCFYGKNDQESENIIEIVVRRKSAAGTSRPPLIDTRALRKKKETCYSRLEDTIQSELEAMKQFEMFAEQDQSECRSEGRSECVWLDSDSMINKLRRVIGSPEAPAAPASESWQKDL